MTIRHEESCNAIMSSPPSKKRKASEPRKQESKDTVIHNDTCIRVKTMFGQTATLRGYAAEMPLVHVADLASCLVAMGIDTAGHVKATAELVYDGKLLDTSLRVSDFPSWNGRKTVLFARWSHGVYKNDELLSAGLGSWIVVPASSS
jgi:hypothetical protein